MNCKKCLHEEACAAWIQYGKTLYDDFEYSVNGCPYYAAKVVHGRWIEYGESIYCSACGFETSSLLPYVCDGEKWVPCYANKYCGNCGAKMDG
jgi:hypothetical protein